MRDAPAYPCGATMWIDSARWIASHRVDRVESVEGGLLLISGNSAHRTHCGWGLHFANGGSKGVVDLESSIYAHIGGILEWEAAHPDQHPVGSHAGSIRHRAWTALRRLRHEDLERCLSKELLIQEGPGMRGMRLRPAGTGVHVIGGGHFAVLATMGTDSIWSREGDVGVVAVGHMASGDVEWTHLLPDRHIADLSDLAPQTAKVA